MKRVFLTALLLGSALLAARSGKGAPAERDARVFPLSGPDGWRAAGEELPLDYVFEPGRADDGVTVRVQLSVSPLAVSSEISASRVG